MAEDLAPFHHEVHVPGDADVGQRITWHRDDVCDLTLGQPASVTDIDQVGGDDRGRAQHRGGRHAPVDQRDELVGVAAVWDRGCVGAYGDLYPGFVCRLD